MFGELLLTLLRLVAHIGHAVSLCFFSLRGASALNFKTCTGGFRPLAGRTANGAVRLGSVPKRGSSTEHIRNYAPRRSVHAALVLLVLLVLLDLGLHRP
jgi:hypothetical protein